MILLIFPSCSRKSLSAGYRARQAITENFRPNWEEIVLTYRKVWNWRNNFSIHLYARFMPLVDKPERTIDEIKYLNTTYGEIARFVLFGKSKLFELPLA